jgi:hypothetical protein
LTKQTAGFLIGSKGLETVTFEVRNASSKERSRLLAIGKGEKWQVKIVNVEENVDGSEGESSDF